MRRTEVTLLCISLIIGAVFGWLFSGFSLNGFLIGLTASALFYSISSIRRLHKVLSWLRQDQVNDPPESTGEWGELLDGLYRLRRKHSQQQKNLADRITHLQNSFASLADAVVLLNDADEIDWFNDSAVRLLGLKSPEDQGQVVHNLLRQPEFLEYFEDGEYEKPLEMLSPEADTIELELYITRFGKDSRMLFVRNVTDVRRLERTRTDFIANVSHELRTPLTVITGYLETMADAENDWLPAIMQMRNQARRMEDLLADLMQLNRLESVPEKSQADSIDIQSLIRTVFDEVSVARPDQTLKLKIKTNACLLGNQQELYSAFSNLIHNASKYSADDGLITVTWMLDASGASLSVEDSGVGIEAQHLSRLTERFYRADPSRHSTSGGTGLGLAIVKHVLLRHQAALTIESTPNKGSCFTCHFPEARIGRSTSELQ